MQEHTILLGLTTSHLVTITSALLAAIVVMFGWYVAKERENANRQSTMRTAYIVEAYEDLALAANRPTITPEYARMMERAVAKIQLFGTIEEIAGVNHFIETWNEAQPDGRPRGDLDLALKALRNSLRSELSLAAVDGPIMWIRPLGGAQ